MIFSPGQTSKFVDVCVIGDMLDEPDETYFVNLSAPVNGIITDPQGQGTIVDNDDPFGSLSINDVAVYEGDSGVRYATFTITLPSGPPPGQTVTVQYRAINGTAVCPTDFWCGGGLAIFGAGQTSQQVRYGVYGDTLVEPDETFFVELFNPSNAIIWDGVGTGTILNDDQIWISINDVTVTEGNSGTTPATFRVSLSKATTSTVTVSYTTANGTATAPSDYGSQSGTLTFAPNQEFIDVTINVNGDTQLEEDEQFFMNLSSPTNAAIADNQGRGTILDDDTPKITINDVTVTEGDTGTVQATFTVSVAPAGANTITVQFATSNQTATAGSDYVAQSGTLTFAPGQTSAAISIDVLPDLIYELTETFTVHLSNATIARIVDPSGIGTILDNDPVPSFSINDVTVTEGNTGTVNATFTVSLTGATSLPASVSYATADNTATAPSDYTTVSGTLSFAPGTTSQTVTVAVNGDILHEINESFFVNLSGPINATITDGQGRGTILDDDTMPSVSIDDVQIVEGNSGTRAAVFTLSLSNPSGMTTTVDYETTFSTAFAPHDYIEASGTVSFPPETTTVTLTVDVVGETVFEQDETFRVYLSGATNAQIADALGICTILNDDSRPTVTVSDATVTEGNSGTVNATFTLRLSNPSFEYIVVSYGTQDDTAVHPTDYLGQGGAVTFEEWEPTSKTITIKVVGDASYEATERFFFILSEPENVTIADGLGIGTILNDDAPPTIAINDVTVIEGDSGTSTATFTVSLSVPSGLAASVHYATANGTATAPSDYTSSSGTVYFSPGTASQTITVAVVGETVYEPDESFFVNLSSPTGATVADSQGRGTILNDDPVPPEISINDVSVLEGDSGVVLATFTVSLSHASNQTVTVEYATANGTAIAPGDYYATGGALGFPAGTKSASLSVTVNGDTLLETDEIFFVNLTTPSGGTINDSQGTGTIVNDDSIPPTISINDVSVTEGNSGTVSAIFTVTLSHASNAVVTVQYSTANGSATAPSDYAAVNETLTFSPGTISQTLTVAVNGDTTFEPDEVFYVNLSGATASTIQDGQGVGTILNDDSMPTVSINDVSVTEGNIGTVGATFTVTLSNASSQTVTVAFATADGTASSATDYYAISGTLTIAAGATSQTIVVGVRGDTLFEANETFFVNLSAPTGATIADGQGVGTIVNDDVAPSLSINDVTVTEGNSGTVTAAFTVSLSAPSGLPATVQFATTDGLATAPDDYASTSGTLTIPAGQTTGTINVPVYGDLLTEPDEDFLVKLSAATGATIADNTGVGVIRDDDNVIISINDVSVTEGDAGIVYASFTVSLSHASGGLVTVEYATQDGTATAPADYIAASGTLVFAAGTTTKTINVAVQGDTLYEPNETFYLQLSHATDARIGAGQGGGTILDDDSMPTISVSDVEVLDGNSGQTIVHFFVFLSNRSSQNISLNYATANNTATAPSDYTAASETISIPAGQQKTLIPIRINGDTLVEPTERFFLNLSSASGAYIVDSQGVGTILDDDGYASLWISDAGIVEGNSGTSNALFRVTLSRPMGYPVFVSYSTSNGTAIKLSDYTPISGILTFPAGAINQTIAVAVLGDTVPEPDETFFVTISSGNASIARGRATGWIFDDDAPPTLSINDVTVQEGDAGTKNATFTVSLSAPSSQTVTVQFTTTDYTATAPADYSATSGTVTFPAGTMTQTVTVPVNGDTLPESDERFFVTLSSPTNATLGDPVGVGTILDDDLLPYISINDVSVTEGNAGTTDATFTVSLSTTSSRSVTVNYFTRNGSATAGLDYLYRAGLLTFPPGTTSQSVTVPVIGETLVESDEDFHGVLASPVNATIDSTDGVGVGTIINDDYYYPPGGGEPPGGGSCRDFFPDTLCGGGGETENPPPPPGGGSRDESKPDVSIDSVNVVEGQLASFTVSLSRSHDKLVAVRYETIDGTARAPEDYRSKTGFIAFAPGTTMRRVGVATVEDDIYEATEHFEVILTDPVEANIGNYKGFAWIEDNDPAPSISIRDASVVEGDEGTTPAYFVLQLSNRAAMPVTVHYETEDGTAEAPDDYISKSGTATFEPKGLLALVRIDVVGDKEYEPTEYFSVELSNPVNATLRDDEGIGFILNDDPTVNLLIDSNNNGVVHLNDDPIEENPPGKFILVNDDDDNTNEVPDLNDPPGFADDDLAELQILSEFLPSDPSEYTWTLTFPSNVRVYRSNNRTSPIASEQEHSGPLPTIAYVEGVFGSMAFGDVEFELSVSIDNRRLEDSVLATVTYRPDLDIDSNNDNSNDDPDRTRLEERIEDIAGDMHKPGKILLSNIEDADGDEVPNFADGIDRFGNSGYDASPEFVPFILELPGELSLAASTIRFTYNASDPGQVTRTGNDTDGYVYQPAPGRIRIWSKNGHESRLVAPVDAGGDYVATNQDYLVSSLPSSAQIAERTWRFFVEAVAVSQTVAEPRIRLDFAPLGSGPIAGLDDAVRTTIINWQLVEVDESNNTKPATQIAYSHSSPVISMTAYELSNLRASEARDRIIGDLRLAGAIDCAVCDYTPRARGTIDQVFVFMNGAESPVGWIATQVTKASGGQSFLKSADFSATFDHTFSAIELLPGVNHLTLNAADKVYDIAGFVEFVVEVIAQAPSPVTVDFSRYVATLDFHGIGSVAALSPTTPVDLTVTYAGNSFAGTIYRTSDSPFVLSSVDTTVTVSDPAALDAALALGTAGSFEAAILVPQLIPLALNFVVKETGPDSSRFGTSIIDLELSFPSGLSADAADPLQARVRENGASWIVRNLTETGFATGIFRDTTSGAEVSLAVGSSIDPTYPDVLEVALTEPSLGLASETMTVNETADDSKVFVSETSVTIGRDNLQDYTGYTFSVGAPQILTQSDGGDFHPYLLQFVGPDEFIIAVDSIETEDGPRELIRGPDGKYYMAAKGQSGESAQPAILQFVEKPQEPLNPPGAISRALEYATDSAKFVGGVVVGFFQGGVQLVEDAWTLTKGVFKGTWYVIKVPFRFVTGDSFEAEKQFGLKVRDTLETVGSVIWRVMSDEQAVIDALLLGDWDELNHISEPYRLAVECLVEFFEELGKEFLDMTPYEKGKIVGRVLFEVAGFLVPMTKLKEVTKLKVLTELKARSIATQIPAVGRALDKLADLFVYLARTDICFVAGTPIHTASGLKRIEEIRVGDLVLSRDPLTGEQTTKPVVATVVTRPDTLLHLRVQSEAAHTADLTTTPNHPFYVRTRRAFLPASELRAGDVLQLADGASVSIISGEIESAADGETFTTYNFEVQDFHTYFAGELGVWVHNSGRTTCERLASAYKRYVRNFFPNDPWKAFEKLLDVTKDVPSQRARVDAHLEKVAKEAIVDSYVEALKKVPPDVTKIPSYDRTDTVLKGRRGAAKINSHHTIPRYVQEILGIPKRYWDEAPAYLLERQPGHEAFHAILRRLISERRVNGRLTRMPAREVIQHMEDAYQQFGHPEVWEVAKQWLRGVPGNHRGLLLRVIGHLGSKVEKSETDAPPISSIERARIEGGVLFVSVRDSDELRRARIYDAIASVDREMMPYGVTLVVSGSGRSANLQVSVDTSSVCGDATDGVLGCTTSTGHITILEGWNWYFGGDPKRIGSEQFDFQSVVLHELGHALGLGHTHDTSSAMNAFLAPGYVRRELYHSEQQDSDHDFEHAVAFAKVVGQQRGSLPTIFLHELPPAEGSSHASVPGDIFVAGNGYDLILNASDSSKDYLVGGFAELETLPTQPGSSPEAHSIHEALAFDETWAFLLSEWFEEAEACVRSAWLEDVQF